MEVIAVFSPVARILQNPVEVSIIVVHGGTVTDGALQVCLDTTVS